MDTTSREAASSPSETLLHPDEPAPVFVERPAGSSPFLLTCDHAGRAVPRRLGRLGLDEREFDRHIAYDVGIAAVSRLLADALDAVLIGQRYSRLVIDCNRPIVAPSSIPPISEATRIPGNEGLDETARQGRVDAIFRPYHDALATELDRRAAAGQRTVLVAMHSFTPCYLGVTRPWQIGTLYGRDRRLAGALRSVLLQDAGLIVGDNEPYAVSDDTDYAIPVYGEGRRLVHTGIEIRQDLITQSDGQAAWAERLAKAFPDALALCDRSGP